MRPILGLWKCHVFGLDIFDTRCASKFEVKQCLWLKFNNVPSGWKKSNSALLYRVPSRKELKWLDHALRIKKIELPTKFKHHDWKRPRGLETIWRSKILGAIRQHKLKKFEWPHTFSSVCFSLAIDGKTWREGVKKCVASTWITSLKKHHRFKIKSLCFVNENLFRSARNFWGRLWYYAHWKEIQ